MCNDDNEFMMVAIKEAEKAYRNGEVPVGAVIVKDNRIIASSHNMKEKGKCSIYHAEILAIKMAAKKLNNWRLSDCVIYVTMEPCPMCASAIKQSRVVKVIYGIDNKNVENKEITRKILRSVDENKPVEIEKSNLDEKYFSIIDVFFKNKRY